MKATQASALGIIIAALTAAPAHAALPQEFETLALNCAPQTAPSTLRAIVLQESSGNPYAIGINGGAQLPRQPASAEEAVAIASALMARGVNFDAGIAQINSGNFEWLGLTPKNLFEPCTNLMAAEKILMGCFLKARQKFSHEQKALLAALSCYNTGSLHKGFENGYVSKVLHKAIIKIPAIDPYPVPAQRTAAPDDHIGKEHRDQSSQEKSRPSGSADAFKRAVPDAFTRAKNRKNNF